MLEAATGTQMVHVPYKQASDLYIGVGNGDVNWAFGSAGSAGAMYRAGKVKYLAVAAPERSSGYPDVPTVKEAGGPADLEVKAWVALLAPHGTPPAIVEKINQDLKPILALTLRSASASPLLASSPTPRHPPRSRRRGRTT